jgi:hypothetical protein
MIDKLLAEHEQFKSKWLRLNLEDLFNWNMLLEAMMDCRVNSYSKYLEDKNKLENKKAARWAELRSEKTEDGKKKNTESGIEWIIKIEFENEDIELALVKAWIDMLGNKITTIPEYINLAKRCLPI